MSKTHNITPSHFEESIMKKITTHEINMKPRWYFIIGSLFLLLGLIGFSIGTVFLTTITFFLLRQHGPMGEWRLQLMLESFPLWIPLLAIGGFIAGIWMLKQYEFSYKKNFLLIIIGFILSVVISAFIIDAFGLNDIWFRQGPMRRFYQQQTDTTESITPRGQGRMRQR